MEGMGGVNKVFWRGRKVFLTGHTGFKGSWLSLWLTELGAAVTGYALQPPTQPSLFALAGLEASMHSVIADIRDAERLQAAMIQAMPEVVIHLAAQPLVLASYQDPVGTYGTNVMGTVNLLEAIRRCSSVKAVVNVTTDKCYENREWVWGYREQDPLGGYDPYSSSKACAEMVTAAYRNSFFSADDYDRHGVALATARAGNVIGGGDWAADRLVPDCIRALSSGTTVRIRNPHSIRPWQHVLEPLRGYLFLAERLYTDGPAFAESWNFGPLDADARPVEWIVKTLCEAWDQSAGYVVEFAEQKHEANYLKLDCSKAAARLDWVPRWNLRTALSHVVEWAWAYLEGQDMRETSLRQIREYQETKTGE